ncbi:uncharacterized protein IL334_000567 [Kwoniella shivajii]|uniref:Glycoside hydrolase 131 catalytic N-terminal domain-containing protein n=1 Tax=Kwoniella shivajii TaxID=564305 RepID=A0ABZ1CQI1_9TREE|nr:hypothetical protein IL334_000567 [Kwoniella shivajii]
MICSNILVLLMTTFLVNGLTIPRNVPDNNGGLTKRSHLIKPLAVYNVQQQPTKVKASESESPLTNAQRMAAGMLPAFPRVLEGLVPPRARKQSKRGNEGGSTPSPGTVWIPEEPKMDHPTIIFSDTDDASVKKEVSFDIKIFDKMSSTLYISSNGVLSFKKGTSDGYNTALPTHANDFPSYSVMPFWDDLYYSGYQDHVTFQTDAHSFQVKYQARSHSESGYIDVHIYYITSKPGVFYLYYGSDTTLDGDSATVGAQGGSVKNGNSKYVSYDYDTAKTITPGLKLVIDTNGSGKIQKAS